MRVTGAWQAGAIKCERRDFRSLRRSLLTWLEQAGFNHNGRGLGVLRQSNTEGT
jgi:hypothetical protein